MQRRMVQKIQTLESKVDVVRHHWEISIFNWLRKAIALKDEGMKNLLHDVRKIPPIIREFILHNYIK